MKLTIERAAFLRSLAHVQSVVERRNTIPILSNVLITAEACPRAAQGADPWGDAADLAATDLDLSIVERVAAKVTEPGATTTPAHTLYDIVRKLPEGSEIELSQTGDASRLTLQAGRSRFTLASLPAADFPSMAGGELPHQFRIPPGDLRRLIDKTRFAISTEETRYYLNGIYLHPATSDAGPANGSADAARGQAHGSAGAARGQVHGSADAARGQVLRSVATDGHRLAQVDLPLPSGASGMPGVIVPRKAVGELRKLLDDAEEEVAIALSETRIRFGVGQAVLTSKLVDGTYPDYTRVIPFENDHIFEVDDRSFRAAVDRVSTISSEKSRAVKLSLENNRATLSVTSAEAGDATEEVAIAYDGAPLQVGFNARYLMDIMDQIDGEVAQYAIAAAPDRAALVRDPGDARAIYVLMPLRV